MGMTPINSQQMLPSAVKSRFSGFKSRWTIPLLCKYSWIVQHKTSLCSQTTASIISSES